MNVALIVAAGKAARFGAENKQLVRLKGRYLLSYSVEAFALASTVDKIIIAVPEGCERLYSEKIVRPGSAGDKIQLVAGGGTRQESVDATLRACPAKTDLVWVHDGARPLVRPDQIDLMVARLGGLDGLVLASRAVDTIKFVSDGLIEKTLARESIWHAQTPQLFRFATLVRAYASAVDFSATDDSVLVEKAGGRVAVMENDQKNLKVTDKADLLLVEKILGEQGAS